PSETTKKSSSMMAARPCRAWKIPVMTSRAAAKNAPPIAQPETGPRGVSYSVTGAPFRPTSDGRRPVTGGGTTHVLHDPPDGDGAHHRPERMRFVHIRLRRVIAAVSGAWSTRALGRAPSSGEVCDDRPATTTSGKDDA